MNKIRPIDWRDEFNIGVPEIDLQHNKLVQLFNDTLKWMGSSSGMAGWEAVVYDFLAYALYHFHSEEALANQYGYGKEDPSQALSHHNEHEAFLAHLKETQASLKSGKEITKLGIVTFIHDWLINHIRHNDMPLGEFIQAKRAIE
jgi:hemerythrin